MEILDIFDTYLSCGIDFASLIFYYLIDFVNIKIIIYCQLFGS